MGQSRRQVEFEDKTSSLLAGLNRFSHEAMATTFEIFIQHNDARYAGQAARAAFDEVDRLEGLLSRYIENSDICRINNLAAGESVPVGLDTFKCLQIAAKMHEQTEGIFDITIGHLVSLWRNEDKTPAAPSERELDAARQKTGMGLVKLDADGYTVEVSVGGIQLDLGGIGKGYAVDKVCELLRDWEVERSLVSGGYSTVAALEAPLDKEAGEKKCWPVTLSDPRNRERIISRLCLENHVLSSSGVEKGGHIIDPRSGTPVNGRIGAWAVAPDAATADALSTSFMVMNDKQIEKYCDRHADVMGMVMPNGRDKGRYKGKVIRFGRWEDIVVG